MSELAQYIGIKTRVINTGFILTHMLRGLPYTPKNNTTLNQYFGVQHPVTLANGEYPRLQYYAIGDNGSRTVASASGRVTPRPVKHRPRDQAPFNIIPFVIRRADNDLPLDRRGNYAMRVPLEIGGIAYIAYYLKRLPIREGEVVNLQNVTVVNGEPVPTPFVATANDLRPSHPTIPPVGSIPTVTNGDYIASSLIVNDPWTDFDLAEFNTACTILYGEDEVALIDEIVLVAGVDRTIQVTGPSGNYPFNECVCAQAVQHLPTYDVMSLGEPDAGYTFELGVTEANLTEA